MPTQHWHFGAGAAKQDNPAIIGCFVQMQRYHVPAWSNILAKNSHDEGNEAWLCLAGSRCQVRVEFDNGMLVNGVV